MTDLIPNFAGPGKGWVFTNEWIKPGEFAYIDFENELFTFDDPAETSIDLQLTFVVEHTTTGTTYGAYMQLWKRSNQDEPQDIELNLPRLTWDSALVLLKGVRLPLALLQAIAAREGIA